MTAYGFKARFGPKIITKSKTQTMRLPRKDGRLPPVDGELQMFTGMRTPQCIRLGTATVKAVYPISIDWEHSWVDVQMKPAGKPYRLNRAELDRFAVADGFENWLELYEFFHKVHGAEPFKGYLIIWGDTFEPAVLNRAQDKDALLKAHKDRFRPGGIGSAPSGHIIHNSLDHEKMPSDSLAECDCGWVNRVPWARGGHADQDAAIEQHWQDIEAAHGGGA